jgi:preprotein translocase subunit SecG
MDTFTIILIVLGAVLVIAVIVSQVRGRRGGHHISQNASMGGTSNNIANHTAQTNIHNHNDFGGTPGTL